MPKMGKIWSFLRELKIAGADKHIHKLEHSVTNATGIYLQMFYG